MNKHLTKMSAEADLAYMRRHEKKIVNTIGKERYNNLVNLLDDYIKRKSVSIKPEASNVACIACDGTGEETYLGGDCEFCLGVGYHE